MAGAWRRQFVEIGAGGRTGTDMDGWKIGLEMFLDFVKWIEENKLGESMR